MALILSDIRGDPTGTAGRNRRPGSEGCYRARAEAARAPRPRPGRRAAVCYDRSRSPLPLRGEGPGVGASSDTLPLRPRPRSSVDRGLSIPLGGIPSFIRLSDIVSEEIVLKIHEYQAKEILRRYGVADAARAGDRRSRTRRARICAGARRPLRRQGADPRRRPRQGRRRQARQVARRGARARAKILGMQLVTPQTGPEGQQVRKVLIEETADIDQELYSRSRSTAPRASR